MIKNIEKGFTLIELLVVISIIAVLAGIILSVVNVNALRGRARDSQRASDLGKIQVALENYYQDYRQYPVSASWIKVPAANGSDIITTALTGDGSSGNPSYIGQIPVDPTNNSTAASPCTDTTAYRYNYITTTAANGAQLYVLTAIMENAASVGVHTCNASGVSNWSTLNCSNPPATCYAVQNP